MVSATPSPFSNSKALVPKLGLREEDREDSLTSSTMASLVRAMSEDEAVCERDEIVGAMEAIFRRAANDCALICLEKLGQVRAEYDEMVLNLRASNDQMMKVTLSEAQMMVSSAGQKTVSSAALKGGWTGSAQKGRKGSADKGVVELVSESNMDTSFGRSESRSSDKDSLFERSACPRGGGTDNKRTNAKAMDSSFEDGDESQATPRSRADTATSDPDFDAAKTVLRRFASKINAERLHARDLFRDASVSDVGEVSTKDFRRVLKEFGFNVTGTQHAAIVSMLDSGLTGLINVKDLHGTITRALTSTIRFAKSSSTQGLPVQARPVQGMSPRNNEQTENHAVARRRGSFSGNASEVESAPGGQQTSLRGPQAAHGHARGHACSGDLSSEEFVKYFTAYCDSSSTPRPSIATPRRQEYAVAASPRHKALTGSKGKGKAEGRRVTRRDPVQDLTVQDPMEGGGIAKIISKIYEAAYTDDNVGEIDETFFKRIDRNGTGSFGSRDWLKIVRKDLRLSKEEISDDEVFDVFTMLDENGTGSLDVSEFMELAKSLSHHDA